MIPSISSFEIINIVSAAYSAAFNPNDIKTLLASGLSIFFIKSKPAFSTGPRSLPRKPPNCTISEC